MKNKDRLTDRELAEQVITQLEESIVETEDTITKLQFEEKFRNQKLILSNSGRGKMELGLGRVQQQILQHEESKAFMEEYVAFLKKYKEELT